jgi:2-dehydropantoate 2-reductase
MRILVMGAGAMGSVVGGFMAGAGHEVTLLGIDPHMRAIREGGLHISGIWGDHHIQNCTVLTDAAGLKRGAFDQIFVTVKSYDTQTAVDIVAPLVDDDTLVCPYQNGLGNAEIVAAAVGWERIVGARVIFGAWIP